MDKFWEEFGRKLNYTPPTDEEIAAAYLKTVDQLGAEIKQKHSIDTDIMNMMDDVLEILRETEAIERFIKGRYYWLCLLDRFMIMIKWKDYKIWYFYGDNYVRIGND